MSLKSLWIAIGSVLMLTGCRYWDARGRDSLDIVTCSVGAGFGAKGRVGPVNAGLGFYAPVYGVESGQAGKINGGMCSGNTDAQILFFGAQSSTQAYELNYRNKAYVAENIIIPFSGDIYTGKNPAYWTQIEVYAGVFGGLRVGLNPGELIDFILGFTGIDIYGDDAPTLIAK